MQLVNIWKSIYNCSDIYCSQSLSGQCLSQTHNLNSLNSSCCLPQQQKKLHSFHETNKLHHHHQHQRHHVTRATQHIKHTKQYTNFRFVVDIPKTPNISTQFSVNGVCCAIYKRIGEYTIYLCWQLYLYVQQYSSLYVVCVCL